MRTSRSAANPGRQFFKCPHPSEADACLKIAWVDEWTGGPVPATQPVRCASQHSGRMRCSAAAIEHASVARAAYGCCAYLGTKTTRAVPHAGRILGSML
jgi:hypothetical protein